MIRGEHGAGKKPARKKLVVLATICLGACWVAVHPRLLSVQLLFGTSGAERGRFSRQLEFRSGREILDIVLQIVRARQRLSIQGNLAAGCTHEAKARDECQSCEACQVSIVGFAGHNSDAFVMSAMPGG